MSRTNARRGITDPINRCELLEGDVDALDIAFADWRDKIDRRMASQQAILLGILVSLTTGAILLALNIAVLKGGS